MKFSHLLFCLFMAALSATSLYGQTPQSTEVDSAPASAPEVGSVLPALETDSAVATTPVVAPTPAKVSLDGLGVDSNSINYALPREYVLAAQPRFEGITTLDEKSLAARTRLEAGQVMNIPGDETATAIRNLWKMGLFSDIEMYIEKVTGNSVFLTFKTTELPKMGKYRFTGLRKSEEDDLRTRLKLVYGLPYKDHVRQRIINEVEDYFADKGFLKTTVDVFAKPNPEKANEVILNIDVVKGYKVKIDEIAFTGNENLSDNKLRRRMKETKEKFRLDLGGQNEKWIDWDMLKPAPLVQALANVNYKGVQEAVGERLRLKVFSSSKFDPDLYRIDKDMVIAYYNSNGFRDAKVTADTNYYLDDQTMRIDIDVDEGKRYHFGDITWKGNQKYSNGRLDSILEIKRGDIYNVERLERKLRFDDKSIDITSLYMDDGYLFFAINPVEVRVSEDTLIDVEIRVTEGPQATIRNVWIKGNTRTNEDVIRRELRTKPGDKFSRSKLIRTQRELAATGVFDPEQIGVNPIPNPNDGTVDLEYTVVEKPSDQLELSAGWGGQGRGVVGSVGVSFNNFSLRNMFKRQEWTPLPQGDLQKLSFRVNTNGRFYQSYNMSFTEPWLGGRRPNSLTFSAFRTLLSNGVAPSDNGRQSFASNGVTLAYGIRLKFPDDFFSLLTSINFQNYRLTNWTQNSFFLSDGNIYNLSSRVTLARNSAGPNPYFPESGSNVSLSLQLTPPLSAFNSKNYSELPAEDRFKWIEYHKWRFNADWYTQMFDKFVLKTTAKFGFIGFYNNDIGHSSFEQFQLGGDGLSNFTIEGFDILALRGYEQFRDPSNGAVENKPIFNKFTMELRYPISLNPSSTIYALLFAEGGNTYTGFDDYNPFEVKRSVGFGVRAFLPMFGLLGLDYGIRFDDAPGDAVIDNSGNAFDYILNNGKFSIILGFEPE